MTCLPVPTSGCDIIAELIVEGVPAGACAVGTFTFQPEIAGPACGARTGLQANPHVKEALKCATAAGCELVAEPLEDGLRILVRDTQRGYRNAKRTYRALNTHEGMMWLKQFLTHM